MTQVQFHKEKDVSHHDFRVYLRGHALTPKKKHALTASKNHESVPVIKQGEKRVISYPVTLVVQPKYKNLNRKS